MKNCPNMIRVCLLFPLVFATILYADASEDTLVFCRIDIASSAQIDALVLLGVSIEMNISRGGSVFGTVSRNNFDRIMKAGFCARGR
jgi:hypothetical protein